MDKKKVKDQINEEKLGWGGDKDGTKLERLLHLSIWALNIGGVLGGF